MSDQARVVRGCAAVVAVVLMVAGLPGWSAATAAGSGAAESMLMVRGSVGAGLYREQGADGASIGVGVGTASYSGVSAPVIYFNSQVNAQLSTLVSITMSVGLTPGTYRTTRLAGQGKPILDLSLAACGDDEPGTLIIAEASYDDAGKPTVLAASFDVENCGNGGGVLHGEIRWNSTAALGAAQAPAQSQIADPVVVNSVVELPVSFSAKGNEAITLGMATIDQTPLWDGSVYWSIAADGCSGKVLQPGQTCVITMRFAPKRPNGSPYGTIGAWVDLPDGQPFPARAQISAKVVPLPGQVGGVVAQGAFRHLVLSWSPPQAYLASWQQPPSGYLTYHVYRVLAGGSLRFVGDTEYTYFVVGGLPDGFTGTYVVTASQGGATGPDSVPGAGTTATSEELVADFYGGLMNQRIAAAPESRASTFFGSGLYSSSSEFEDLAVSGDQSVLALTSEYLHEVPTLYSVVRTARVDGSSGADFTTAPVGGAQPQWDVDPALSRDGSRIVYTHAAQAGDPTELRVASTATGSSGSTVPGSDGLSDAVFSPDGTKLIAVQPFDGSTRLVQLDLASGDMAPLAGTAGMSQPDVAADGRIVATLGTDVAQPAASELVLYSGGTATPIAAAASGTNCHAEFSSDGSTIFYKHSDTAKPCDRLTSLSLNLTTGTSTAFPTSGWSTAYALQADGSDDADTTPPSVHMHIAVTASTLADTVTVTWSAIDPAIAGAATSGVSSYDIRYRRATAGQGFGAYRSWLADTTQTSGRLPVAAGSQYCVSIRARDVANNTSQWSAEHCFAKPLDDRAWTTTGLPATGARYYDRTYTKMSGTSTRSYLRNVTADRVGVVVATCPACGSLKVWLAGTYLGHLNTASATRRYRQTIWLPAFAQQSGQLVIKPASSAKVLLDGVVTLRSTSP